MSSFTAPLILEFRSHNRWIVCQPFRYYIGAEGSIHYVDVEGGFITDHANVPSVLWRIFTPWGRWAKAALVHDKLYTSHRYKSGGYSLTCTRREADAIFYEAMRVLKVGWFKRTILWLAVRAFGNKAWVTW